MSAKLLITNRFVIFSELLIKNLNQISRVISCAISGVNVCEQRLKLTSGFSNFLNFNWVCNTQNLVLNWLNWLHAIKVANFNWWKSLHNLFNFHTCWFSGDINNQSIKECFLTFHKLSQAYWSLLFCVTVCSRRVSWVDWNNFLARHTIISFSELSVSPRKRAKKKKKMWAKFTLQKISHKQRNKEQIFTCFWNVTELRVIRRYTGELPEIFDFLITLSSRDW